MDSPTQIHRLDLARRYIAQGQTMHAIDLLKQVLSDDPEHVEGHALMAMCLLAQKRLHAAELEAFAAMAQGPDSPLALYALAGVQLAQRKLKPAEETLTTLLDLEPEDPENHRAMARLQTLRGRREAARKSLDEAYRLDPEDPNTLSALGAHALATGNSSEAARYALRALRLHPEHGDAHVVMGQVALREGDLDEARGHAAQALRMDPEDDGALHLFASIKARQSWFLGLWWRYSVWMGSLGDGRAILVLLCAFALYRFASLAASDYGNVAAASLVHAGWIGICIYTWVGPFFFRKALNKELGEVALREDF